MSDQPIPVLNNTAARRLFLDRHALLDTPSGPARGEDLLGLITRLGFVQVDSINTVERAHHMILFSRRPAYRPKHIKPLLERDRSLFEHWTHDASIIPSEFYPHWQLKFERDFERLKTRWKNWHRHGFEEKFDTILKQIEKNGPVSSGDVGEDEERGKGGWWDWHPSKTALEFLWRSGQLSVCHRAGFTKVYDLTERIIPQTHRQTRPGVEATVGFACSAALDRLGFATSGELAAFFDLVTPEEAKNWCRDNLASGKLIEIEIGLADGSRRKAFGRPDLLDVTTDLPEPTGRLRVLNPFDPALRDRKRAERLFGFHYRIEVFVPEAKRQYGYYVFPLLEGDRLVGRIDMKARRAEDRLLVRALWPERGTRFGKGRLKRLEAELDRVARLSGCSRVDFEDGWQREAK